MFIKKMKNIVLHFSLIIFCFPNTSSHHIGMNLHRRPIRPQLPYVRPAFNIQHAPGSLRRGLIKRIDPVSEMYINREANDRQFRRPLKRKELQVVQRHVEKCSFPYRIKVLRRSDDHDGEESDLIRIRLPYGYMDEYYPKAEPENYLNSTVPSKKSKDIRDEASNTHNGNERNHNDKSNQATTKNSKGFDSHRPLRKLQMSFLSKHESEWQPFSSSNAVSFARIPPFRPIRTPIPSWALQKIFLPRPWSDPTPWKVSKPGSYSTNLPLKEPFPGLFEGSPPKLTNVPSSEKRIIPVKLSDSTQLTNLKIPSIKVKPNPVNKEHMFSTESDLNSNKSKKILTYSVPEHSLTRPFEKSQLDYSLHNIYEDKTEMDNVTRSQSKVKDDSKESVSTVTPLSVWAANSRIYYQNRNSSGSGNQPGQAEINWVPVTGIYSVKTRNNESRTEELSTSSKKKNLQTEALRLTKIL